MKKILFAFLIIIKTSYSQVTLTATVGTTTGSYTTLKGAFDAINLGTHKGAIVISINANTTEASMARIYQSGYNSVSNYSSINIFPTTSGLSISGSISDALINLDGADNVTLDGRVNGTGSSKDLIIANTSTSGINYTSTIKFINDATGNFIKYCTLKGSSQASNGGVLVFTSASNTGTGNDNNTIENNNITSNSDATRPINTIYAYGTNLKENDNNIINNNNIFDFFSKSTASYCINIQPYNSAYTISNNSFYETTQFAPSTAVTYRVMYIISSSGVNFNITGNFIGGSSAECGGSWTKTNSNSNLLEVINLDVGTSTASNIQNNKISNISYSNSSNSNFTAIYIGAGSVNIGTTAANIIGASTSGNDSIYINNAGSGSIFYGINIISTATVDIQNNIIGFIRLTNTAANNFDFYGINKSSSSGATTISNNIIGNSQTENSINTTSLSSSSSQNVVGISSAGTGVVTISGNVISNLTNGTTNNTVSTAGMISGIYITGATTVISNNLIKNLKISNKNLGTLPPAVSGIYTASVSGSSTITGNTIYNLSNTSSIFAPHIVGIFYNNATASTQNLIEKNFIHSLNTVSNTAILSGIYVNKPNLQFRNNIIRLGIDIEGNSITSCAQINGVYQSQHSSSYNNSSFQNNTIFIGGTGVTIGALRTYCFNSNSNASPSLTDTVRNNIFVNVREDLSASRYHFSVYYKNIPGVSDYNIYYYSSTDGQLDDAYNTLQTFRHFQLTKLNDFHSAIGDPKLINPNGSLANINLNISTSGTTPVEGTGFTTNNFLDDFAGSTRSNLSPSDIGAYAGNYNSQTSADELFTPVISYSTFTSAVAVTPQLTNFATITDQITGVNTTSGTRPRFYYKKSGDANAFAGNTSSNNGWKWVEATNSSSPFNFTIDHTILNGGVPTSGTINYFVVAQDLATTPNVLFWPLAGSVGSSVSSITTAPSSPNSYTILIATAIAPTEKTSTSFKANWNASSGATGYYLDVSTDNTFSSYLSGYENLNVGNVLYTTITGLNSSTNYYYRVRATNATGISSNSSTITSSSLPTVQATNITIGAFTYVGYTASLTRGNGSKCAIFIKASATDSPLPVDNITYTANTTFGSGSQIGSSGWYCVYNGTGNSVTVTGLRKGITYKLKAVEYNGAAASETYLQLDETENPKNQAILGSTGLTGTKTIKASSGDYPTITAAIAAYNTYGVGVGGVIFLLGDNNYSTSETFPINIKPFASSGNTLLIKPAPGIGNVLIQGSYMGGLIKLDSADYVTIDGLNSSGNTLTIENTSTNTSANAIRISTDATNNIIRNCTLLGSSAYAGTGTNGVICFIGSGISAIQINYCNVGPSGNNKPAHGVVSASSSSTVSNITIDHCNIYDFYSAADGTTIGAGLYLGHLSNTVSNETWTITNNSFYQTAILSCTGSKLLGIYIHLGNNYTISNNYFGGSQPNVGGTAMTINGSPFVLGFLHVDGHSSYSGISNSSGSNVVSDNTISNINFTSSNSSAAGDYSDGARFFAFSIHSGNWSITNNVIGSMNSNDNIILNDANASTYNIIHIFGSISSTLGPVISSISGNTIGGISVNSGNANLNLLYIFYQSTGYKSQVDLVSNNTFGSNLANSISMANNGSTNYLKGIKSIASNTSTPLNINNNIFQNYNLNHGSIYIITASQDLTCTANTFKNISTTSGSDCIAISISSNDNYANSNISKNYIKNLKAATNITGISATSYYRTVTLSNNIVVLGGDVSANVNIYGLSEYYLHDVYFNTIYIEGTGTSGSSNSYAYYRNNSWTNSAYVKNNIFHNARINSGGTGSHYAAHVGSSSTITLNYNDYFVSGSGGVLGYYPSANVTSLPNANLGSNSQNQNPNFAANPGTDLRDFKPTNIAVVAGTAISGITTDYSGFTRPSTPTIGAIEFTNDHNPLPIELKSFTARTQNNNVILNWKTITETNNSGFEVERSLRQTTQATVLRNWEKVAFVRGSGTSSVEKNYFYSDNNLRNGKYSYRLKQIDLDGTTEYSQTKEVEVGNKNRKLRTNPNPFNSTTIIKFEVEEKTEVTIKLYDLLGRIVAEIVSDELKEVGEHEVKFNANHLTSGVYLLKFQTNKNSLVEKLVLMK